MNDNTNPAATSGDAPDDLQQLKALALAWTSVYGSWLSEGQIADGITDEDAVNLIRAANPAVVLGLIARIERLTTVPEQAPSTEQEWAKVDPAVAFHLIERHAEDWADAGRMMEAWRAAVSAATKPTADLSQLQRYGYHTAHARIEPKYDGMFVKLADVQSLLATKPAGVPEGFAWPSPPPRKGQSNVLFDDGYDEGWAKCIDTVRNMLAAPTAAPADHADKRAEILIEVEEAIDLVIRDLEFDVAERSGAISCRTAIRALKSAAPEGAEGAAS